MKRHHGKHLTDKHKHKSMGQIFDLTDGQFGQRVRYREYQHRVSKRDEGAYDLLTQINLCPRVAARDDVFDRPAVIEKHYKSSKNAEYHHTARLDETGFIKGRRIYDQRAEYEVGVLLTGVSHSVDDRLDVVVHKHISERLNGDKGDYRAENI